MKLIHYTSKKTDLDFQRKYVDDFEKNATLKPTGLWVSVKGEDDWKWWCEEIEWDNRITHAYEVKTKENANILYLKSPFELHEFTKQYLGDHGLPEITKINLYINWSKVKKEYQGIIIVPYQWSCRFDLMWYYGWDCASGCIWDLSCIEEVKPVKSETDVEAV